MQVWKLKRGGKGEADGIWQGEGDGKEIENVLFGRRVGSGFHSKVFLKRR